MTFPPILCSGLNFSMSKNRFLWFSTWIWWSLMYSRHWSNGCHSPLALGALGLIRMNVALAHRLPWGNCAYPHCLALTTLSHGFLSPSTLISSFLSAFGFVFLDLPNQCFIGGIISFFDEPCVFFSEVECACRCRFFHVECLYKFGY